VHPVKVEAQLVTPPVLKKHNTEYVLNKVEFKGTVS
jgi:hypothetical protein